MASLFNLKRITSKHTLGDNKLRSYIQKLGKIDYLKEELVNNLFFDDFIRYTLKKFNRLTFKVTNFLILTFKCYR